MPIWAIILTSAGVSAIVSSVATLLGQLWERRSRRHDLLLRMAVDLTQIRNAHARREGRKRAPVEEVALARDYYDALRTMLNDRSPPPTASETAQWLGEEQVKTRSLRAQKIARMKALAEQRDLADATPHTRSGDARHEEKEDSSG
jgi:hypothetical protein